MNKYTYTPPMPKRALIKAYVTDGLSQCECAEKFGVSQKRIFTAMKHYAIPARGAAKRDQRGENNNNWRGADAGKSAFHRRLYAKFGKPKECLVCGTTDTSRSYDYANLTGNYHDPDDYKAMCRSCHWKYDKKIHNIKHMRSDADDQA